MCYMGKIRYVLHGGRYVMCYMGKICYVFLVDDQVYTLCVVLFRKHCDIRGAGFKYYLVLKIFQEYSSLKSIFVKSLNLS
jgi:hypothetical protein